MYMQGFPKKGGMRKLGYEWNFFNIFFSYFSNTKDFWKETYCMIDEKKETADWGTKINKAVKLDEYLFIIS